MPPRRATVFMPPQEYRNTIKALGLNISSAARFLHKNVRTSRRWARGEQPIDAPIAMLLRVMMFYQLRPIEVAHMAGAVVQKKKKVRKPVDV
jgi:hypothetical protein